MTDKWLTKLRQKESHLKGPLLGRDSIKTFDMSGGKTPSILTLSAW
jgi:hypothetical protein